MRTSMMASIGAAGLLCAALSEPAVAMNNGPATQGYPNLERGSLIAAISDVHRRAPGKILEIRLVHGERAGADYNAVVGRPGGSIVYLMHRTRGDKVTVTTDRVPRGMQDAALRADLSSAALATEPLANCVSAAEQADQAPAMSIRLARPTTGSDSVLAYDVSVVRDGQTNHVMVDGQTDEVIANGQNLQNPWSPERIVRNELHSAAQSG